MLSLSRVNVEQGQSYFIKSEESKKEDYYAQGSGQWHGKLATILGVAGDVKEEEFKTFLAGKDMENRFQIKSGGHGSKHSAGLDMTFSAPKSVSIVGAILDDKRIFEAHNKAVNYVLDLIEKEYTGVRLKIQGQVKHEKTGNALIAKFQHLSSRELDPQLHSHCVVMNFSKKDNGDMRAMDFKDVFDNKLYLGQVYRSELALNLKEMGFNIKSDEKGFFNIEGVPDVLLKEFSKRTEQVNAKYEELKISHPDLSPSELRQIAALETRKAKDEPPISELIKEWDKSLENCGITKELLKQELARHQNVNHIKTSNEQIEVIDNILRSAIKILSEQEAILSQEQILEVACRIGLGEFREKDFKERIPHLDNLIKLDTNIYTTKETYAMERDIVNIVINGKNQYHETTDKILINRSIIYYEAKEGFKLTSGQKNAISHILSSSDRVIAVQGDAGTGKTTMLDVVRTITEIEGKEIMGLSFTGKAASEIEDASKIKSSTIASFLAKDENLHGKIVVIDEASMLSIRDTHAVLKRCNEDTKVVLIGDTKQLQSMGQGKIFSSLQEKNIINSVRMSEIQRQVDTEYKEVVINLSNKEVVLAIEKLDAQNKVVEIIHRNDRLIKIVNEYVKNPKDSIIVTASNRDREELNQQIRKKLQALQKIGNEGYTFSVKEPKSLSVEEKMTAYGYSLGDQIITNKAGILGEAGTVGKVVGVEYKTHFLEIESNGKLYQVDIKKEGYNFQVYAQKTKQFSNNEKILFLKNDNFLNVKNGQTAIVKGISRDGMLNLLMDNGQTKKINLEKDYNYISHGYALTDYKSQGQTAKHVIFHVDTTKRVNYNQVYVGITRGKESVIVITDDTQAFKDRAQQEQRKTSTLDYNIENPKTNIGKTAVKVQIKKINSNGLKSEKAIKQFSSKIRSIETSYWEADKISEHLANNVEKLLNDLGYKKLIKASNQYRIGKKGSLAVTYAGSKKGYWNDFETGEGGKTLISFIQRETGLDFKESLEYSAGVLGLGEFDKTKEIKTFLVNDPKEEKFDEHQIKMIKVAQSIASKTSSAEGTIVENYLRTRGITAKIPDSITFNENIYINKYNKNFSAMAVKLHDEKGVMQSIHLTLLENGKKAEVETVKLKFGPSPNIISVNLNATKPTKDITLVAEGLETALSLKSAFPDHDVRATLEKSAFNRIDLASTSNNIIMCLDNDLKNWKEDKIITNAINRLNEAGKNVQVAFPDSIDNKKTDFNDILCVRGTSAVKNIVNNAEKYNAIDQIKARENINKEIER